MTGNILFFAKYFGTRQGVDLDKTIDIVQEELTHRSLQTVGLAIWHCTSSACLAGKQ
jgi:hypothetical protein